MSHIDKEFSQLFQRSTHIEKYQRLRPKLLEEIRDRIFNYLNEWDNDFKLAIDIGCGSGQSISGVAPSFKKVIGYDISEAQIQQAIEQHRDYPNVTFALHDCHDPFPLDKGSVDFVIMVATLHWLDRSLVTKHIDNVLKPGGVIAVVDYSAPMPAPSIPNADLLYKLTYELLFEINYIHDSNYTQSVFGQIEPMRDVYNNHIIISQRKCPIRICEDSKSDHDVNRINDQIYQDMTLSLHDYISLLETFSFMNNAPVRLGKDVYNQRMDRFVRDTKRIMKCDPDLSISDVHLPVRINYELAIIRKPILAF